MPEVMTEVEAHDVVARRGLHVSAGPQQRRATDRRPGALMAWVVSAEAVDTPRGVGETLAEAVQHLLEVEG